jgi:hypothetical protein
VKGYNNNSRPKRKLEKSAHAWSRVLNNVPNIYERLPKAEKAPSLPTSSCSGQETVNRPKHVEDRKYAFDTENGKQFGLKTGMNQPLARQAPFGGNYLSKWKSIVEAKCLQQLETHEQQGFFTYEHLCSQRANPECAYTMRDGGCERYEMRGRLFIFYLLCPM